VDEDGTPSQSTDGEQMNPITVMAVLALGVLLFGKNLPDVARQVGLALMEFKRGMNELKGTLDIGSLEPVSSRSKVRSEDVSESPVQESQESVGTKFEPPQDV
jgi:sec-independent protein translocase protein TatA